jgi:uncharacterized surface protein with fasciclin (FAS1) repeats
MNTLIDVAVANGHLKTVGVALKTADLVPTLKGKGPLTVSALNDAVFAKSPRSDLDALLKDKAKLKAVLTCYVVCGKVMSTDLKAGNVKTVQGSDLLVSTMGDATLNKAKVVTDDVAADTGVMHAIDTVLMPQ